MEFKKAKWLTNPTKKQIILFSLIWLIYVLFALFIGSNFFTKNPFIKQNLWFFIIAFLPIINLITIYKNYFKNKHEGIGSSQF